MKKLLIPLGLQLIAAAFSRRAEGYIRPRKRSCGRQLQGCLTLVIFLLLFACIALTLAVYSARGAEAAADNDQSLVIYLVIDNSASMYELGGLGTDPDFLRIDAARLFISYLGIDDSRFTHRCGVIFFGSEAEIAAPLATLGDETERNGLLTRISEPGNMGWTDQVAALRLARLELETQIKASRAIVLLTDGKPEWKPQPTAAEQEAYALLLEEEGQRLAEAGIALFIVLLANEATDADPGINQIWQPVWKELAEATPPGQFYIARKATELPGIYHNVVVTLSGGVAAAAVVDQVVGAEGLRETLPIEPDLARLTLVVSKEQPTLTVAILQPDGSLLTDALPTVRFAGQSGITNEELWVIDNPTAGEWTVIVNGEGRVTVWKDHRQHAVTATATSIATSAMATPLQAAATVTPTATLTPEPTATVETPAVMVAVKVAVATTPEPAHPEEQNQEIAAAIEQEKSMSRWLWPLGLLLVASFGGAAGYWQWRGQQPIIAGELRHLSGPGFSGGERLIELDHLRQARITIGPSSADIPLMTVTNALTLRTGRPVGNCREVIASGAAEVSVNGQPLTNEIVLEDGDLIQIGESQFRYENLRLRSVSRALQYV